MVLDDHAVKTFITIGCVLFYRVAYFSSLLLISAK